VRVPLNLADFGAVRIVRRRTRNPRGLFFDPAGCTQPAPSASLCTPGVYNERHIAFSYQK
jgi:hypothetical protein